MKVAAIDCGTNSIRLLVAARSDDGGLTEFARELVITRLGQGVDATGALHPDALARTFEALRGYAQTITAQECALVSCCATSAARDASNASVFRDGVRHILGVEPRIISGAEEARLSFTGARLGLPGIADPTLVMDIGGGSTELVRGSGSTISHGVSLDMGSVRVRERFFSGPVPSTDEVSRARAFVDGLLDHADVPLEGATSFVGVAGTATSLAAMAQGLTTYDRARVHGSRLGRDDVDTLTETLLSIDAEETMRRFPLLPRGRAEVISAGALICQRVLTRADADHLLISETDILDGIALSLLAPEALH